MELLIDDVDNHPEREPLLEPFVVKMAKMNMVFIGLDLYLAEVTFQQMKLSYIRAGGPSFSYEQFHPQEGNETASIAHLLESRALNLVDHTISQTCTFAVGREPDMSPSLADVPTLPVTAGTVIPVSRDALTRLYDYRDVMYVAQGVYGRVYQAIRSSDEVQVAVKHTFFKNDEFRKFFRRELTALQTLAHPACLSYYDSQEYNSDGILVTPFQVGETLQIALSREASRDPLPNWLTKKTIIAFGVAFGMEHMHKRGFAHRDLKPANVFLNAELEPIIGDLGLATDFKEGEKSTEPSMAMGTPLHMAPELWTDESDGYSYKVDVYAYAILVYSLFVKDPSEMLDDNKGRPTAPRLLLKRTRQGTRFQRVPEINDAYWALITASWDHRPDKRPSFTEILNEMINNVPKFLMSGVDATDVQRYINKMHNYR
jgi:serine/threonine protein kinase